MSRQHYEQQRSEHDFATAFAMARRAQDNERMDREMDQELEDIMDTVSMLDEHCNTVLEDGPTSPAALPGSPETRREQRGPSEELMLPTMGSVFTTPARSIPPPQYTPPAPPAATTPHQELAFHQVGWGTTEQSSEPVQTLEVDDSSDESDESDDDDTMEDK